MATDKIRKYVLPNIPYLFIGWFCLKIGTAYRLAAGAGFGEKLLGLGVSDALMLDGGGASPSARPLPALPPALPRWIGLSALWAQSASGC